MVLSATRCWPRSRRSWVCRIQNGAPAADIVGVEPPFDEHIAEGVREGDPDALVACWRVLAHPLVSYLRAQVRDPGIAEDLAQDSFLELVSSCRTLHGGAHEIRGWLFRAAYHNLLDWRRRSARRPEQPLGLAGVDQAARERVDDEVIERVEREALRHALDSLSPDQRQVITLRFLAELSAPEVAAVLGKSEGSVRALQHRGVAALGRLIRDGAVPIALPTAPQQR